MYLLIALFLLFVAIRHGKPALARRLTPLARQLMPAVDRVSAADRAAAAAVWRVLGSVFVTAGVVAGVAWYFTPGPLAPWMLAAYFAWGVIAYLILDHALDRRLRGGWLRNAARLLLTACFVWTLVAPWRLLGRLSDWYFARHPPGSRPMVSPAAYRGFHDDEMFSPAAYGGFHGDNGLGWLWSFDNDHHKSSEIEFNFGSDLFNDPINSHIEGNIFHEHYDRYCG